MKSLKGKNVLIIGGSSGVGKATVEALISDGARVTAVARGADKLQALKAEMGDRLATIHGDATDSAFVERLLREQSPDLVVLAAGVAPRMARVDGSQTNAVVSCQLRTKGVGREETRNPNASRAATSN
jgi:NADP-dependent 3-hydroxy acid dehydrogenase YdfG